MNAQLTEQFDHPIADKVSWAAITPDRGHFRLTHRLNVSESNLLIFKPTKNFIGIKLLIILIDLLVFSYFIWALTKYGMETSNGHYLIGSVVILGKFLYDTFSLYTTGESKYFDTRSGIYYSSWIQRKTDSNSSRKSDIHIGDIIALQIIKKTITIISENTNSSYNSYELNLILKDTTRIKVIDHTKYRLLNRDAHKLGRSLGLPVWNASSINK